MITATLNPIAGPQARTQVQSVLARSVCLTLTCHFLGNNRTIPVNSLVDAVVAEEDKPGTGVLDEQQFHAVKRLVPNSELRPCMRIIDKAKELLRAEAVYAGRVFGERTYLIPDVSLEAVDAKLTDLQQELRAESLALAARYEEAVALQAVRLGKLFKASDYPTRAHVAGAFGIEWDYVSFAAPDRLETVSAVLARRAAERYEGKLNDMLSEVKLVLRETLRQLVGDIARRLEPGPDGKARIIRSTVLDDLAQFLETFPARNLAGDGELAAVVRQLRNLTAGLTPDGLRKDSLLREDVLQQMARATARLDELVVAVDSRRTLAVDTEL